MSKKQVLFVCDFDGNVKSYDQVNSFPFEDFFLSILNNRIYLNVGEVYFAPTLFEARIGNTDICIKDNCIFLINENEFVFGYCFENKLSKLVKDFSFLRKTKLKLEIMFFTILTNTL